ncbi:protein O-linked-mannose beta-1,2-N-acetylglucosaminyltransferase 1-like [Sycon ciliatum]|uniref:protein O-linked-mannose beta-1,2-N-acetylglucosaminyltransferase 1-like n=1 Tax=Sycon ciliatum TaxID=27933 RepID=UPI0031F6C80E|eukprot:scpid33888/ scgid10027/ Protein O-linked-mannose beta-1,2-N-acetylglucosaminyltransferase 1
MVAISHSGSSSQRRWSSLRQFLQLAGVVLLFVTIFANVWFLMDTAAQLKEHQLRHHGHGPKESAADAARHDDEPRVPSAAEVATALPSALAITVISSHSRFSVMVNDKMLVQAVGGDQDRGVHVAVLHPSTGRLMAHQVFDTYMDKTFDALVLFINSVTPGRLLCIAIKDEGTFNLKPPARAILKALGSKAAESLAWRDMWALVATKHGSFHGEEHHRSASLDQWGDPVTLSVSVKPVSLVASVCDWAHTPESKRRQQFCSKYEGYFSLCHCTDPSPLLLHPEPLKGNAIVDTPVAVIAGNRPKYLFRMLRTLLSTSGSDPTMTTVFIDGEYEEPADVARLLGVRAVMHSPLGEKNARISQHYKAAMAGTFNLYPSAEFAILIEEDLDVAPDFFSFFSQTVPLLRSDSSLYCVSAWNDQGYEHTAEDVTMLYRVETMPGLGWLLKRSLFKNELEPAWPSPDKLWDWDMWMRTPGVRKGRECVIPDVSRTFHFGSTGLNMNPYFQETYFAKHKVNTIAHARLTQVERLSRNGYEELLQLLVKAGSLLDHSKSPCDQDFVPDIKDKINIMLIQMKSENDFETWLQVAKCFKIWDLDARGFHKGLWRLWMKSSQLIVIGLPYSPYSRFLPTFTPSPIYMAKPTTAAPVASTKPG